MCAVTVSFWQKTLLHEAFYLNKREQGCAVTSIVSAPVVRSPDELDSLAMLGSPWQQKLLILVVAAFRPVLASIYAYSAKLEYRASTRLRPVTLDDPDELNRTKIYSLPPAEALKRVAVALDSYDARLAYFRSTPEFQEAMVRPGLTVEQAIEQFNSKVLKLIQPDPKMPSSVSDFIGLDLWYPEGHIYEPYQTS